MINAIEQTDMDAYATVMPSEEFARRILAGPVGETDIALFTRPIPEGATHLFVESHLGKLPGDQYLMTARASIISQTQIDHYDVLEVLSEVRITLNLMVDDVYEVASNFADSPAKRASIYNMVGMVDTTPQTQDWPTFNLSSVGASQ